MIIGKLPFKNYPDECMVKMQLSFGWEKCFKFAGLSLLLQKSSIHFQGFSSIVI